MTTPTEQNDERRKSGEKTLSLVQLNGILLFSNEEEASTPIRHELKLQDPQRRLIHQGSLGYNSKQKEYRVFLLDNALVITEPRPVGGRERLRVIYNPIPIALLQVSLNQRRAMLFGRIPLPLSEVRHQLRVSSLGKRFNNGKDLTLLSPTGEAANTWIDAIHSQQEANQLDIESNVLKLGQDILKGHGGTKVNCVALYNNEQAILYGTRDGMYSRPQNGHSQRVTDLTNVRQIEVLEDLSLLVVLAERAVFTFPLEALEAEEPMRHMKRIGSQISFFEVGTCLGRTMICTVKTASLSSTVKALEAIEYLPKPNLNERVQSWSPIANEDRLKEFREFYLATELRTVQFLKTKLCVASAGGFELVDLETLDTQPLLDPQDQKLEFTRRIDPHPLSMYRIGGEFLVCYREFAFYVNKSGNKSDKDVVIYWEGTPTACALHYPYIVAFSSNFVEVRHVDDGSFVQVIYENDVRCLRSKGSPGEDLAYHLSRARENNILVSSANQVMFLTPILSQ